MHGNEADMYNNNILIIHAHYIYSPPARCLFLHVEGMYTHLTDSFLGCLSPCGIIRIASIHFVSGALQQYYITPDLSFLLVAGMYIHLLDRNPVC